MILIEFPNFFKFFYFFSNINIITIEKKKIKLFFKNLQKIERINAFFYLLTKIKQILRLLLTGFEEMYFLFFLIIKNRGY